MPDKQYPDKSILNQPNSERGRTQQFIIRSDGTVEVPWFSPSDTILVVAVWESISKRPFPVNIGLGKLYCG